jgi:hypothetical protein
MHPFRHLNASLCSYKSLANDAVRLFAALSLPKAMAREPLRQGGANDRSVNPGVARVGIGPIVRISENDKATIMYRSTNRSNTDVTFVLH